MEAMLKTKTQLAALSVAAVLLAAPSLAEARDTERSLLRMRLVAVAPAAKKAPTTPADKATKPAPARAAPAPKPTAAKPGVAKVAPAGDNKADPINDPIPKLSAEAPRGGELTKLELPKDADPPFYERGWFWPVVGVVAAAIIITIVVAESVGGDDRMPTGSLGTIGVIVQ
jgi:hypothetical protein